MKEISEQNKGQKVITRFAPSPTGFMHIGGVRTALFAYLWARKNNGTFILRIEDTDKEREVAGSIEHIQKSLTWLGLEWDFGPDKPGTFGSCIQSERLETYQEFARKLLALGLAYPDPYTLEEVQNFKKQAEAEKRPFLYRNHRPKVALDASAENPAIWDGKQPLRFKVPVIKRYHWHDAARGDLEAGEEALDDFILIKGDGYPTYNFAHIIDDHYMNVTHIFRADEFIASMPRFLSLYDALGMKWPVFVTLPPILRDDRTKKLGKRDGAKDILEYKNEGYLPDAMTNFLALIGWNPGGDAELFDRNELLKLFTLEKIQKAGAVFNEEKLLWMNKQYLAKLSDDVFVAEITKFLPKEISISGSNSNSQAILQKLLPLIREKIHVFNEVPALFGAEGELAFVTNAATFSDNSLPYKKESLMWKKETDICQTKIHLKFIIDTLGQLAGSKKDSTEDSQENFTAENVKAAIWPYAEKIGKGNVLWPMRYSLSGKEKSPDPFVIAGILGKDETLRRLTLAYNAI